MREMSRENVDEAGRQIQVLVEQAVALARVGKPGAAELAAAVRDFADASGRLLEQLNKQLAYLEEQSATA